METDRERNTDRDFSVIGKEGIKFKKNKIKTMKKKKGKEGNPAIRNNMDGSRGHQAKRNKWTEKDKYFMISLVCGT